MEYTTLGNTQLKVSRLGLGCEQLGGVDWGPTDEPSLKAAVVRALELGITLFDTADVYGLGRSESVLAEVLGARRHDVVIVSKFGVNWQPRPDGGRARTFRDASPRRVIEALEDSLRRLRVDSIPLYLVHWPDPATPIASTVEALQRCRETGKIQHFGLSNHSTEQIRDAHRITPLAAVELPYSLLERQAEIDLLPLCSDLGVGVIAYGTLAQGVLSGKYAPGAQFGVDDRRHRSPHFTAQALAGQQATLDRLNAIGTEHKKTAAQVAVRWVLDAPGITCVVVGAKNPGQVDQNSAAADWSLSESDRRWMAGERSTLSKIRPD